MELKDIPIDMIKTLAKMFNITSSGSKKTVADRIAQVRGVKVYGKKYVYFMWEFKYISREKLFENVDMNKVEKSDLSSVYYRFDKEKEAKNMKIKELEKRMW